MALLPALQTLKLQDARLRGTAVANVIKNASTALTHLDLRYNSLKGDTQEVGAIPFYTRLAKLTALTSLRLPRLGVHVKAEAALLATTLRGMAALTALQISAGSLDATAINELVFRGVSVVG